LQHEQHLLHTDVAHGLRVAVADQGRAAREACSRALDTLQV
jgi:hypothetical protein